MTKFVEDQYKAIKVEETSPESYDPIRVSAFFIALFREFDPNVSDEIKFATGSVALYQVFNDNM